MRKLMMAVLAASTVSVSTGALATHFIGVTFTGPDAKRDCEAFLREAKKDGRHARKEFGTEEGTAGSYNQDFNLTCQENGDGSYTTVGG